MARARCGALVVAVLVALAASAVARADGDPASDSLYTGKVFFPYSVSPSKSVQKSLLRTVEESERAGYPIRVALIAGREDLGSVTVLWAKPRKYASFLAIELSFIYKGPLLIVMPGGIGFAHFKHGTAAEYAALRAVPVAGGRDGLATTAIKAISVLAARAGHPVTGGGGGGSSSSAGSRYVVGGAVALVLVALAAGGVILRRRRREI